MKPKRGSRKVHLLNLPNTYTSYVGHHSFTFLNLQMEFKPEIDWNYQEYGKLWVYNLCYFDFLLQRNISKEDGLMLMKNFADRYENITDGLDPYPTSIRLINWIKFLSIINKNDQQLDSIIYSDVSRLSNNIEYHLMGNHLLENGFALLFGGIYFQDQRLIAKAEKLLEEQIKEQILADGAHFELSPMYHQIILSKILDCINLLENNPQSELDRLVKLLAAKASLMVAWMNNTAFQGTGITRLNDSSDKITFRRAIINEYASNLGISKLPIKLTESGYRKYSKTNYEALVDVGNIGPDYIPGHAHSDTFNILVNRDQQPILVDTGISTYEKNALRQSERSTSAHNTVMINGIEQSEVWGGFRVGRRAKSVIIEESDDFISASHDGYDILGVIHNRTFSFGQESILVNDFLSQTCNAKAYFHFHPTITLSIEKNVVFFDNGQIEFRNLHDLKIDTYQYAQEFNKRVDAQMIEVSFNKELSSIITIDGAY